MRVPIGVCGLITPWNWPMNQTCVKIFPALATGCTLEVADLMPRYSHMEPDADLLSLYRRHAEYLMEDGASPEQIDAAVEALGLPPRFILVGHSLGASTVTHYVREHTDRVAGLVLLSGGALRSRVLQTEADRAAFLAQVDGYPGNIDRAYWEREHAGLSPEVRARAWEDWQRVPRQRMLGSRAAVEDAPADLQPTLRAMTVPTLVVFGDDDHTVDPGLSVEAYQLLPPGVRHLHVFHGVDHSPNSIIPRETAEVFLRFAAHLDGATGGVG